ncbi:MAG TPA: TetR/AcrR family transcriptional regulator [Pseudonocardia sp.]|jgi:AcrR family transcriptional regulator|nr:TetR/AcrR family transcriptional regulator [Pseudonocardia sp.]
MPTARFFRLPEERRFAVLEAAEAEFGANGFSRGSVNAIAAAANISKGSLFQYFEDKAELCAYLSDLVCGRIRDAMTARFERLPWSEDFFGSLQSAVEYWMHYYAEHPAELAFTTAVNLEPDPATQRAVRAAVNQHYIDVFQPLLKAAHSSGQLAPEADLDLFLALIMLMLPHLAIAPNLPGLDAVLGLADTAQPDDVASRVITMLRNSFGPHSAR